MKDSHISDMTWALSMTLRCLADLNGCDWIPCDGPGEVDMRQRAKALQRLVFSVLAQSESSRIFDRPKLQSGEHAPATRHAL